jgi:hypothetical protein
MWSRRSLKVREHARRCGSDPVCLTLREKFLQQIFCCCWNLAAASAVLVKKFEKYSSNEQVILPG